MLSPVAKIWYALSPMGDMFLVEKVMAGTAAPGLGAAPQANYQAGLVNYLQVLTADNQYQQARLGYIQAQALRFQDNAALFVALGGGWWHREPQMAGSNPVTPGKTVPEAQASQPAGAK